MLAVLEIQVMYQVLAVVVLAQLVKMLKDQVVEALEALA
jgi:hypothetical protein